MASKENDPLVPWGYGGKVRLSEIPNTTLFKSIDPAFAANILQMITENPTIGVGGADRTDQEVLNNWKDRYRVTNKKLNINDPKIYKAFGEGKYKEYQGKIYELVKGSAVATPNASWHTGGFAVDLVGDTELAGKLADKYNIRQVTSTKEKWHFQPKGTPDGRRVIDFLKNNYGYDPIKTPLPPEALDYINNNFSSNAPSHPKHVLDNIERLLRVKPKKTPKPPTGKGKIYGSKGVVPANGRFTPHSNIMPPRLGGY